MSPTNHRMMGKRLLSVLRYIWRKMSQSIWQCQKLCFNHDNIQTDKLHPLISEDMVGTVASHLSYTIKLLCNALQVAQIIFILTEIYWTKEALFQVDAQFFYNSIDILCTWWDFRFLWQRVWRWQNFWDMALCSITEADISNTCTASIALMEVVCTPETPVYFHKSKQHHILECCHLHSVYLTLKLFTMFKSVFNIYINRCWFSRLYFITNNSGASSISECHNLMDLHEYAPPIAWENLNGYETKKGQALWAPEYKEQCSTSLDDGDRDVPWNSDF